MAGSSGVVATAASRDVETPSGDPGPRRTDFALVIGVDHYPRFRPLQGAVADATSFHAWLRDPDGGGVVPEHARLVVSTPEPPTPLQDQVDEQLLELVAAADAQGGGRRLYFHFSGHGASSPGEAGEDVALLLAKWSRSLARIALSTDAYRSALGGLGLPERARPGGGRLRLALPPGLYGVLFERGGGVHKEIVDHGGETELVHHGPPLGSPAPLASVGPRARTPRRSRRPPTSTTSSRRGGSASSAPARRSAPRPTEAGCSRPPRARCCRTRPSRICASASRRRTCSGAARAARRRPR